MVIYFIPCQATSGPRQQCKKNRTMLWVPKTTTLKPGTRNTATPAGWCFFTQIWGGLSREAGTESWLQLHRAGYSQKEPRSERVGICLKIASSSMNSILVVTVSLSPSPPLAGYKLVIMLLRGTRKLHIVFISPYLLFSLCCGVFISTTTVSRLHLPLFILTGTD